MQFIPLLGHVFVLYNYTGTVNEIWNVCNLIFWVEWCNKLLQGNFVQQKQNYLDVPAIISYTDLLLNMYRIKRHRATKRFS